MSNNSCHNIHFHAQRYLGVFAALFILSGAGFAWAASAENPTADKNVLFFSADKKAIYDPRNSSVEFIGNVKVTQDTTVIRADTLKIFLKEGESISLTKSMNDEDFDRLVATGHVNIDLEGGTAVSEQAVYSTDTKLLVLSGSETKFTRGKNTISGKTITYDRSNGTVTVDGPVEADIFSNEEL